MSDKGHARKKTPIRKSISDAELHHSDPTSSSKILRSAPRPNYCETNKRGKKRPLDCDSFENMCLEREGGPRKNPNNGTRSKHYSGDHKNCASTCTGKNMALTDSDDSFYIKDGDVSNQVVISGSKTKKAINKGTQMSDLKPSPVDDQACNSSKNDDENCFIVNNICPICKKEFPDDHEYTLHIREHNANDKQSHVCQICSKKLSSASSLDRHMFVHSGEKRFKCSICDRAFTTNGNMHRHKRRHYKMKLAISGSKKSENKEAVIPKKTVYRISEDGNSETFRCPVCNHRFISPESLDQHMTNHPNDAIECGKCDIVSQNYVNYKKHACPKLEVLKSKSGVCKAENDSVVGFSDLTFTDFSIKKFPLIAKDACEAQARRPSSDALAFVCHVCSKAFPCNRTLKQHEKTHKENANAFCDECQWDISSPNHRHTHHLKHQSMKKYVKIKIDDRLESDKDNFLAVLGLQAVTLRPRANDVPVSSNREPEDCISQERLYNGISVTDTEMLKINSKQNYQAENSNDFADISAIISLTSEATLPDMRSSPVTAAPASPENDVVDQDRESPVIEGSANSTFDLSSSENTNSNRDSDSHNDTSNNQKSLQCRQCSLCFGTKKALRSHARSHSQTGSHCCNFCTYKSVDKSTLLRHMRTHNGERPFKCSLCDYAFTTKANSHRHVKKKHKLPDNKIASAVVYNPNMIDKTSTENIPCENSGETVCKYCGKNLNHPRMLRHHLRSINGSCEKKPFVCQICNLGFSTKNNCIRHINQQHPECKDNIHKWIIINEPEPNSQVQQKQDLNVESFANTIKDDSDNHHQEKCVNLNAISSMETLTEQVDLQDSTNEHNLPVYRSEDTQLKTNMDEETGHIEHPTQIQDVLNTAIPEQQNSGCSEDIVFSVAESLVSLSFQIDPLDLSVRPIDLSYKSSSSRDYGNSVGNYPGNNMLNSSASTIEEQYVPQPAHSSPVMTRIQASEDQLDNFPLNLVQRDQNQIVLQQPVPVTLTPFIILPQSIIASTSKIMDNHSNPISYANDACFPMNIENDNSKDACMSQMKLVKNQLVSNDKRIVCEYCLNRFTLKSNKERHVKKKHPEYARPARSRNYIPSLPDAGRKCSDRTRDAILSHLNAHSNTKDNGNIEDIKISIVSPLIRNQSMSNASHKNMQIAEGKGYFEQNSRNEFESNDLASVSSVIDTANSGVINMTDVNGSDARQWYPSSFGKIATSIESDSEESIKLNKVTSAENSKELACDYCGHTFPWPSSLDRHMRTHTGAKPYRCLGCPLTFSTKSNLDRHLKKKCCPKINYKFQTSCLQSDLKRSQKNQPQLHDSDKLLTENSMKGECSSHTFDWQQNNSAFSSVSPSTSSNPPSFSCSTTLKTVAHVASLRFQSMDNSQTEFECKFCPSTCNTQDDLTNHMKELHVLEYRSLMGETIEQTKETVLSWNNAKRKRDDNSDKFESSTPSKTYKSDFPCVETNSESGTDNTLIMDLLGMENPEATIEQTKETVLSWNNAKRIRYDNSDTFESSTPSKTYKSDFPCVETNSESGTDNTLIMDLLGMENPEAIDEMIDSTARIKLENKY